MSKNSRLSIAILCTAASLFLVAQAKGETVNYWMKMKEIMQGGGTDFQPMIQASEYAETLSYEQLSVLDGQFLSDTELQHQVSEQESELIVGMIYTNYFEKKKISFDDFLNDMTLNKRRHSVMWIYMCLTSALPRQEVQGLDADKAEKLYTVLKTQALHPEAKLMTTCTLMAMIVSTVKDIPFLRDKLAETAEMLMQTLMKFEREDSKVVEAAVLVTEQFGELKPLIDQDPRFKEILKAKLSSAASKTSNAQLKSLLLSLCGN